MPSRDPRFLFGNFRYLEVGRVSRSQYKSVMEAPLAEDLPVDLMDRLEELDEARLERLQRRQMEDLVKADGRISRQQQREEVYSPHPSSEKLSEASCTRRRPLLRFCGPHRMRRPHVSHAGRSRRFLGTARLILKIVGRTTLLESH